MPTTTKQPTSGQKPSAMTLLVNTVLLAQNDQWLTNKFEHVIIHTYFGDTE